MNEKNLDFERRRHNHTHMNIAPLVDVVFLLLLFFMLSSHLTREPVIKIKLPESKTSEVYGNAVKTIYISKDGSIFFMNRKVDLALLSVEIKSSLNNNDDFIQIKADKEADVGILIGVIDEVRLLGIRNYSIATERR